MLVQSVGTRDIQIPKQKRSLLTQHVHTDLVIHSTEKQIGDYRLLGLPLVDLGYIMVISRQSTRCCTRTDHSELLGRRTLRNSLLPFPRTIWKPLCKMYASGCLRVPVSRSMVSEVAATMLG